MKKVSDLNFYAFVEFWQILKSKFPKHHFELNNLGLGDFISISSVVYDATEPGEIILEVQDPKTFSIGSKEELERVDVSDRIIKINFFVHSSNWASFQLRVPQESFDDLKFIELLTSLIGKVFPSRGLSDDEWNYQGEEWTKKVIYDSGIEAYGTLVLQE